MTCRNPPAKRQRGKSEEGRQSDSWRKRAKDAVPPVAVNFSKEAEERSESGGQTVKGKDC